MHPLLARFLDLRVAAETLHRAEKGQALSSEEHLYAEIARASPAHRDQVLESEGRSRITAQAQQALLLLGARTALASLRGDEHAAPALARAEEALRTEGAADEQVDHFLAMLLLEEALGYEESDGRFDRDFFVETLAGVPALVRLTSSRVEALVERFAERAPPPERAAWREAARQLVEVAWEDGPEPITPEHLAAVLELGPEHPRPLSDLLEFFASEGLIGPLRLQRLRTEVELLPAAHA